MIVTRATKTLEKLEAVVESFVIYSFNSWSEARKTMFSAVILINFLLTFSSVECQTADTSNPAFTNIAPCPCDLTANQFDNNCCCDEDYSGISEYNPVLVSDCISGTFGGNFSTADNRLCTTTEAFTPDWFPLTCIQFLNSPDLGLFYYPSTQPSLDIQPDPNNYDITDPLLPTFTCGSSQTYNYSDAILGAYESSSGCGSGILTSPQQSLTGGCVRQSPVQFLVNTDASCDVAVTRALCNADTILDAAYYVTAQVRSITTQAGTISYSCAQNVDDSLFVKTNLGATEPQGQSLFGPNPTSSPTPCSYSSPSFDEPSGVCSNAVASVTFTFSWDSANITSFDISITLVNVTLTTSDSIVTGGPTNVLTQNFATTFTPITSSTSVALSGFPGYEFGLPVISASDIGAADVNRTSQLTVWKPGSSGLCADASREPPQFGFDSLSGCTIVFGFLNCTELRSMVETQQMLLLEANVVSRFGNPSSTASSSDWIPVLSNFTTFVEENTTTGSCDGIPSRAVVEFMWAKSGEQSAQAIREIVGARVSMDRETWNIRCTETQTSCDTSSYAIYSEVTFTEVPPQAPTPETLYELSRNDTCQKSATCWPELLLPIQSEFFYLYDSTTANTLQSYNYGWALLVTFFSVAAVLVPANWSSVGKYLKQVLPV